MKATELRIGNLVSFNGDQCEVVGLNQLFNDEPYNIELKLPDGLFAEIPIEDDDLKHIPISKDWLLKNGFLLPIQSKDWIQYIKNPNDEFPIKIMFEKGNKKFMLQILKGIELKSVHQLQNIYFALTGEELNIPTY